MKEKMNKAVEEVEDRFKSEAADCKRWKEQCVYLTERADVCEKIVEGHSEEMEKMKDKHEKEIKEMKETNDKYQLDLEKKNIDLSKVQEELDDLKLFFHI